MRTIIIIIIIIIHRFIYCAMIQASFATTEMRLIIEAQDLIRLDKIYHIL